jgi:hypothetical protein
MQRDGTTAVDGDSDYIESIGIIESTITNTEVDLIDLHPQEPRAGRRRTGRKDLVEPRMTKVTKAAIYTKEPQLLAWSSRAGLSAGEWMSLQGWQQRQLFSGAQQWPSEMSVSSDFLNGNTSTVFVTDGPCSTSQHIDGISGASSMMKDGRCSCGGIWTTITG